MAEQKTIGQKLYELINPCKAGDPIRPAMWDEVDEDYHAHYERAAAAFLNSEAAASAVWDQAVAKCIEAINNLDPQTGDDVGSFRVANALAQLLNERKWRPIWTPEQVSNLHAWQRADHVHPFTCPHRDDHLVIDGDKGILIPTVRGWICQFCDYTQDWAHSSMLSGPHNMPLPLPPSPEENA